MSRNEGVPHTAQARRTSATGVARYGRRGATGGKNCPRRADGSAPCGEKEKSSADAEVRCFLRNFARRQMTTSPDAATMHQGTAFRLHHRRNNRFTKNHPIVMAKQSRTSASAKKVVWEFPYSRKNFMIFGLGIVVIIIGYLLMSTGISDEASHQQAWNNHWPYR